MIGLAAQAALAADPLGISWSALPSLPPPPGEQKQPGVASPFVGTQGGSLLVAGGANFLSAPPWEGGKKTWWDTVFVLDKKDPLHWKLAGRLPRPLAYGLSFSLPTGVLCVGGRDEKGCRAEVFLLSWNGDKIECVNFPSLPEPLAFAAGGMAAGKIFVAGGQPDEGSAASTNRAYMLDLKRTPLTWERLPDLPGPARSLCISFALVRSGFYVIGGRDQPPGEASRVFRDGYCYDPSLCQWRRLKDLPEPLMAGTAVELGEGEAIVLGGDNGEMFLTLEKLATDLHQAQAKASTDVPALMARQKNLLENHLGFSRKSYLYSAASDTWDAAGLLPEWPPVTTTAVWWNDLLVLPSGEVRPGVRSSKVWAGRIVP